MERTTECNAVRLRGTLAGTPAFSHESRGERFYTFPLQVQRLSGNSDTLNIVLRQAQLGAVEAAEREKLLITGQLRSYNNRRGAGAKLVLTVLARELLLCDGPDENLVRLTGTLCRTPNLRVTPMGRDICDLMLAVRRSYGRSDYLPCICWGQRACEAARWPVGTALRLEGRFQSRSYIKLTEEGPSERVAYEVSATEAEAAETADCLG
ncbi:MAG: single-stranded DNA-binding protein [Oscillospiraceae bacterium]|nr:single-stranded DNA-binding protein [Oscillospiraceae bacterium]